MGIPNAPAYGNTDVGSAIADIEKIVAKIKTNKFSKKDIIKLHHANTDLIKAIIDNDYED